MKRLLPIACVLLLLAGMGVVFWPSPAEDAVTASTFTNPEPARAISPVSAPVTPAPRIAAATLSGGVHRHGKGVVGAQVIAKSERDVFFALTGEGGGFLLTLPPDAYLVSAKLEDEASQVAGPLPLAAAEQKQGVVLELLPSATLLGVVLNEQTREAISQARVVTAGGSALTNPAGRFELRGVSVGEAWIEVSAKGFISRTEWLTVDVARRLSGMEIALTPGALIRGKVTRLGEPVAGAQVWAEGDSRSVSVTAGPSTATDLNGAFELQLGAGKVQLVAAAPNEGRVEGPKLTVASSDTVEGVQIELGQQLLTTGQVTVDGEPAAGPRLTVFDARTGKIASSASGDGSGRFELLGLAPGTYLVQVRVAGLDAQRGPFQVSGASDEPWSVVLERAGVIRGRVVPPSAGVMVRLRSSDWVGSGASVSTDAAGRFLFEGITNDSTVEAEGPAGYAEARAKPNEEVVLALEQAVLRGSVTNENGRAVTDFAVRLRPLAGGPAKTHAVLSPTGRFRIQTAPGDYEVSAFSAGAAWAEPVRGTASRGAKSAEVNLKLAQTTSIEATLVDSQTSAPVAGADVQVRIGGAFSAMVFASVPSSSAGVFRFSSVPLSAGLVVFAQGYRPRYLNVGAFAAANQVSGGRPPVIPLERGDAPEWLKTYEGVGISWSGALPTLAVQEVFPGSPAEEAGVVRGDLLISIDGRNANAMKFDQVIEGIRGPAGTAVRLGFSRGGTPYEVAIRRRAISL